MGDRVLSGSGDGIKRGGDNMSDELIKDILLDLLKRGCIYVDGENNSDVAKQIAEFVNTLRELTA
jgi:hypothetical protein